MQVQRRQCEHEEQRRRRHGGDHGVAEDGLENRGLEATALAVVLPEPVQRPTAGSTHCRRAGPSWPHSTSSTTHSRVAPALVEEQYFLPTTVTVTMRSSRPSPASLRKAQRTPRAGPKGPALLCFALFLGA